MILGHRIQWLDFSVVDICGHEEWVITKVKWVGVVAGVRKRFCLSNEDDVGERIYYRVEAFISVAAIFYNLQIRFPSNCPITGEKLGQIPAKKRKWIRRQEMCSLPENRRSSSDQLSDASSQLKSVSSPRKANSSSQELPRDRLCSTSIPIRLLFLAVLTDLTIAMTYRASLITI